MKLRARLAVAVTAAVALAATASGYYPWVHYLTRSAPFIPVPEKFDLTALYNKTVYYYVSDQGPTSMIAGDTFTAVLSQIRFAGRTWNGVGTSDLRVAYGGLFTAGAVQSAPHIEVSFADMPPGLLALGGPTVRASAATTGANGPFFPIVQSVVILNRDMSALASYRTGFFLTTVHEMGHALGLQHTQTSSVMSTDFTRASTKASVLAADDIAGISWLYPNANFQAQSGTITGQVTSGGAGVHLASVVALTAQGQAVSALTNPDGTYRIDGVTPGQYLVYAHPLPPSVQSDLGPSEVVLPLDPDGRSIPAGDPFGALFYPGVQDAQGAAQVPVAAGMTTANINFSVQKRGAPQLYGVTTYSFPGSVAVKPAYVDINNLSRWFLVASGTGIVSNKAPVPGLTVTVLGGSGTVPPGGVHSYLDPNFLEVDFQFNPFTGVGPRHLIFSANGEMYVLPSGLNVVNRKPPLITAVAPGFDTSGNRVVAVTGTSLSADTRVYFDGVQAPVLSYDDTQGQLTVAPPAGPSGYSAAIIALNADGQTSMFLNDQPLFYTYDSAPASSVALSATSLPAGVEAMIDIDAPNMSLSDGEASLGFGTSDIIVKRAWVLSPGKLRADVLVLPQAQPQNTTVSVTSGFQVVSQPFAFQTQPATGQVTLNSDLINAATGQPGAYPGATVLAMVSNLPAGIQAAQLQLTLNDAAVPVSFAAPNQISFQIPAGFPAGMAVMRLQTGGDPVLPVAVQIDKAPPSITGAFLGTTPVEAAHPAHPGDTLTLIVASFADPGSVVQPSRFKVTIGGIDHIPSVPAHPANSAPAQHQVSVILSPLVPGSQPATMITVDGRTSAPFTLHFVSSVKASDDPTASE